MKLTELNAFMINEISNRIDENSDFDNQLQELGANNRNIISEFRATLQKMLFKDLQSLHDVKKFVSRVDSVYKPISLPGKPFPLQKK